ncbi:hypothetical protein CYMTET_50570 [Cymbomonas tetramitiformis]|uniref:N-acetyltransferase domain-containing protein n=1 Tax=Cymbomonas tetramitiformis TaxID=36881 RepID=A0AAE0ET12_9CHLO|nr:hypothetical protein CYMTET_50570 [Cymbomonas tetramitiformis]|eukprot:gene30367-37952_t
MAASDLPPTRLADVEDTDALIRILCGAFRADPLSQWIEQDSSKIDEYHAKLFRGYVENALARGHVYITSDGAACSLNFPPDDQAGPHVAHNENMLTVGTIFETMNEKIMGRQPHFHIAFIGSDIRGKGHGKAILSCALKAADAAKIPCYLENSNEANIGFYKKFGFEVVDKHCFDDGERCATVWFMKRDPAR